MSDETELEASPETSEETSQADDAAETIMGATEGQAEVSETSEQQDDQESGETAETETDAPEAYEWSAPEGYEISDSMKEGLEPIIKDLGLSQEGLNKLTTAYAEVRANEAEKEREAFGEQLKTWTQDLKKDQEFGGDNFDKNAGMVREFLDKTLPADLKGEVTELFNSTGLGSHPAFVKYFHALSKQFPVGEDQPGSGSPASNRGKSLEERLYPDMT